MLLMGLLVQRQTGATFTKIQLWYWDVKDEHNNRPTLELLLSQKKAWKLENMHFALDAYCRFQLGSDEYQRSQQWIKHRHVIKIGFPQEMLEAAASKILFLSRGMCNMSLENTFYCNGALQEEREKQTIHV